MAAILAALPKIDGWKPDISPPDLNQIAQNRFEAMDLGDPEAHPRIPFPVQSKATRTDP
jgi:hypothetical protein